MDKIILPILHNILDLIKHSSQHPVKTNMNFNLIGNFTSLSDAKTKEEVFIRPNKRKLTDDCYFLPNLNSINKTLLCLVFVRKLFFIYRDHQCFKVSRIIL